MSASRLAHSWGWILGASAAVSLVACSGPYQQPLARRQINPDTHTHSSHDAESGLVVNEPVIPAGDSLAERTIAYAQLRERAFGLLLSAASGESAEERANAIEALIQSPPRLKGVAGAALADSSPAVRGIAAMAVGKARLTELASQLRPLISDQFPQVRANAIFALLRCDQPVDPTPLAEMLNSPRPQVRAQAAFVLGELGEKSAVGPLREAHRHGLAKASPAAVRLMELQIAEARAKLGDDDGLIDIRTALFPARAEDLEATALAAQIVGQIGDRASVDRLMYLTAEWDRDKQPLPAEIRLAAASSLAKLGRRQGSFIADQYKANESDILRAQAALVYGDTGWLENLPTLTAMLDDPSGRVRVAAASAIVRITSSAGGLDR